MTTPNVTVTKEYLRYLDALRESGKTNMYGAAPYLREMFPELDRAQARAVLAEWMRTFARRHGKEN
jgi:hypothetical protein